MSTERVTKSYGVEPTVTFDDTEKSDIRIALYSLLKPWNLLENP